MKEHGNRQGHKRTCGEGCIESASGRTDRQEEQDSGWKCIISATTEEVVGQGCAEQCRMSLGPALFVNMSCRHRHKGEIRYDK